MNVPFQAIFLPTGKEMTVEAVTDIGQGRFYWVRSKHGVLVRVPDVAFVRRAA